ncbi:MAG: adenylyltransferase/cytidyltransferase family protein [Chlamydiota bacterium]
MSPWEKESQKKQIDPTNLQGVITTLREQGKTIVTLNGSFDLLHAGHLHIIYEASLQGDILLVCLNSDASIRSYKGASRPIIPLKKRMQMMSACYFVDYVTSFDESTPNAILKIIRPNVHVNGAEYGKDCIEAPVVRSCGGRLHIVSLVPGWSTTQILEKIKQCV